MKNDYIFKMPMKVRDYEVDSEGIVNNAVYLHYLEHSRHEFCDWAGFSFKAMRDKGLVPVLNRAVIDYKRPLGLGEEFVSCLNLSREGARFVFNQVIFNADGDLVVRAKVECVTLVDGRLTRGDELAQAFARFL